MQDNEHLPDLSDQHILWTREEVKAILGIKSDSAFYRTIHNAKFPAPIKLTQRMARWRKSDVLSWLDNQENNVQTRSYHVGRGGKSN